MSFRRWALALVSVLGLAAVSVASTSAAASAPVVTTVVSGLDNPRDLAFGPGGRLYVAEAGHGGPDCVAGGGEGGGNTCIGFTSQISQINVSAGTFRPVVTGIVSITDETGFGATGVDGISLLGNGDLYGIITGSADSIPNDLPLPAATLAKAKAQLGRLIKANPSGHWKSVADVGDTDFAWSADHADLVPGQFPDANPYGVLALPGVQWVVDAGSNTIDRVSPNGSVQVAAFIPNPPASDAVPTCIDRGPDGALYIGELTGGGNGPGASIVWRYAPGEATPLTQWATGLTAVTGCGFGANGTFYAVEFSTDGLEAASPGTGALVSVAPHSSAPVTVLGGLSFPGGFAAGADGSIYLSDWSIAPVFTGLGSVKRVRVS